MASPGLDVPSAADIAYFSMEIALQSEIPTYSGGLGVLAGDMLRSAADLEIPMIGITLVHRLGYFRQKLDAKGIQSAEPEPWNPANFAEPVKVRVAVRLEGRAIAITAWRYRIRGVSGGVVPVYLLDTDLPENTEYDRTLTSELYGGDQRYRLMQEAVLGLGGAELLDALGYTGIRSYHMNEGHAALLALGLLQRLARAGRAAPEDVECVRHRCVFTTHTPVPAGHDKFPRSFVASILGPPLVELLDIAQCFRDDLLNMTYVALRLSRFVNGVAMLHGEVSAHMFPQYSIRAITNGVHAVSWTSPPFCDLFDRRLEGWRDDNLCLRYAIRIPLNEIQNAHRAAKQRMLAEIQVRHGVSLQENVFTIGFARRAAAYKRADLLFTDIERLRRIGRNLGPVQILYAGKAHPHDESGQQMIRRVFGAATALQESGIRVIYLNNYEIDLAGFLTSGVDLWLNTPLRPYEASGTSGMKAALNGVPGLSILDGWWVEGCHEGLTGWAIGDRDATPDPVRESDSLYGKLESIILPMYTRNPNAYTEIMRSVISVNASFFNTNRMLGQYLNEAYFPREKTVALAETAKQGAA
jgi:starch phosphorylase